MAEHIQGTTGRHHLGQRARVIGVDDPHHRAQGPVGNPGLGVHLDKVKDRHAGRFAAGPRGGRHGDQRFQAPRDRLPFTNRRVDIGEKIGRISGIKIGRLGRIHARTATDRDIAIKATRHRKVDGLFERVISWLDACLVIEHGINAFGA